jgi:hypothetical protein
MLSPTLIMERVIDFQTRFSRGVWKEGLGSVHGAPPDNNIFGDPLTAASIHLL